MLRCVPREMQPWILTIWSIHSGANVRQAEYTSYLAMIEGANQAENLWVPWRTLLSWAFLIDSLSPAPSRREIGFRGSDPFVAMAHETGSAQIIPAARNHKTTVERMATHISNLVDMKWEFAMDGLTILPLDISYQNFAHSQGGVNTTANFVKCVDIARTQHYPREVITEWLREVLVIKEEIKNTSNRKQKLIIKPANITELLSQLDASVHWGQCIPLLCPLPSDLTCISTGCDR